FDRPDDGHPVVLPLRAILRRSGHGTDQVGPVGRRVGNHMVTHLYLIDEAPDLGSTGNDGPLPQLRLCLCKSLGELLSADTGGDVRAKLPPANRYDAALPEILVQASAITADHPRSSPSLASPVS